MISERSVLELLSQTIASLRSWAPKKKAGEKKITRTGIELYTFRLILNLTQCTLGSVQNDLSY